MARFLNMSPDEYRNDRPAIPCLSQSVATTMLTKSPLHAWSEHKMLGNQPRPPTKANDEGTLIHKLLLGEGASIVVLPYDEFRTKEARAHRDAVIASGAIPVKQPEYDAANLAAERIRENLAAYGIEFSGKSEVAVEWEEEGDYGMVLCRGMWDHYIGNRGTIFDVKKVALAHPKKCERSIIDFGLDIQWCAYMSALDKLVPELGGMGDFLFLFCETEPPYAVLPARPNGIVRALGASRWERAVKTWERCLRTSKWPSYSEGIHSLDAPAWALGDLEDTP